jgi:two-component system catabolic regulation response regulator CreB
MTKPYILIVEDEKSIADTLIHVLEREGFIVDWVTLGTRAIEMVNQKAFSLMILDIGLPDVNGFEVCKKIRLTNDLPIIFLTARSEEIDRVVGLEIGADDYVTKPFSPREVAARVKVILRRVGIKNTPQHHPENNLNIAPSGCDFSINQQLLVLTAIEFKLLNHLVLHGNVVLSREQLLNACGFATDAGYERNIYSHIKSIRAKIKRHKPGEELIKTHRGFGYCYTVES